MGDLEQHEIIKPEPGTQPEALKVCQRDEKSRLETNYGLTGQTFTFPVREYDLDEKARGRRLAWRRACG
jgi:hypothetical protein